MTLFPSDPEPSEPTPREPQLLTRRGEAVEPAPNLNAQPLARRKLKIGRIALRTFLAICILTVALLLVASIYLRHAMRAALPQIDGTIHASGLSAPVIVTRDDYGVPSIQAATLDDLLFAQGFVAAQDRLWQMDALRRHAAGELAELFGPSLVEHDRTQRTLQIRAAADRAVTVLPPDQLHQLEAYARGVNAFITQNADHLPVEFHILHYTPAPWTPRDTLLVLMAMDQDLSTEFPTKLMRETFSAHLAPELLADLYPVGSWRDHPPTQPPPDLTSPRPEIEQIPLDETQSKLGRPTASPQDLLAARVSLSLQTCEGCRSGSNNWAVAGSRSASGQPLISNDMHLGLGVPDIWYEAGLRTVDGAIDVTGLTLPGAPFVIVGRNAHVAWSFTNLGGDVQDIYIEHLRGTGSATEYKRPDGSWIPAEHHSEHIRVRGGSDVTLDVMTTTHNIGATQMATPVISPLYPSEHRALSLAWTAYDPASLTAPFMAVNAAADGPALVAAFSTFGGPTLNLVYADDRNHIGYHAIGNIPIRGPAVHHPVATPQTPAPANGPPPPASDEDSALHCGPVLRCHPEPKAKDPRISSAPPTFIAAAFQRRRGPHKAAPTQLKEAPIAIPPPPLGYTIGSLIPAVPVDALDPNAQWSGYIPYVELPNIADPVTGFLATANARITPDDYPYAIAIDWASPYRVERIAHLLADSSGLTPTDMLHIEMDVHSELDLALTQRLAYALDHSTNKSHDTQRLHQAADILRRWNGDVDIDASAPAIVAAARAQLWPMLLVPQIAAHDRAAGIDQKRTTPEGVARLYSWDEQSVVLEELMMHTPERWLPPGFANWNDLLATALDRGLTATHAPTDLTTWSYSKTHPVEFNHPLLSNALLPRLLGVTVGSGPRIVAGDTSTIKAISRAYGPTERFTADLSNPNATTSNLTTGQSGNPASPWYLDQLPHWLGGTTLPLPLHDTHIAHTLILQP
jgi:penicillin amidase